MYQPYCARVAVYYGTSSPSEDVEDTLVKEFDFRFRSKNAHDTQKKMDYEYLWDWIEQYIPEMTYINSMKFVKVIEYHPDCIDVPKF